MSEHKAKYSNDVVTPKARASWPKLAVPEQNAKGDPKYCLDLLIPKDVQIDAIKEAVISVAKEAFQGQYNLKNIALPIKDGDERADANCHGHWVMKPWTYQQPKLFGPDNQPLMDAGSIYAGCYVRASITAKSYLYMNKPGVSLILNAVQFLEDGEAFGSGPKDFSNAFDVWAPSGGNMFGDHTGAANGEASGNAAPAPQANDSFGSWEL